MKRCPSCNRTYTDLSLNFCLDDGTPLIVDAPTPDLNATLRYPMARDTVEPPPTEIYRPEQPAVNQVRPIPPPAWTPGPAAYPQQKKSNAIWWVLGGLVVVGIVGIGLVVMIILLASFGANQNENNSNSNVRIANRNTNANTSSNLNANNANESNSNANTSPSSIADDFSEKKWGVSNSKFGDIWYANDEYHMRSKKDTYLVMYAPSNDYKTENATVKVTARSVDGTVPSAGFGLIVHGSQAPKNKGLQDYALLIYPSDQPEYEIITHKEGTQSPLVTRTKSNVIRSGTNPNQLEIRVKGNELSFYINGQYLIRTTDASNYKTGLAGFYTSDTVEVAFDDLEINRN